MALQSLSPGTAHSGAMEYRGANFVVTQQPDGFDGLSHAALSDLAGMGADTVALVVIWYMEGSSTVTIAPGADTPSDACLGQAISHARSLGLRVMLKPHVDCLDGTARTQIAPSDTDAWWVSYCAFMMHYADLARDTGCELLCVGTELSTMQAHEDRRRSLIAEVRSRGYSGAITYAANWDAVGTVHFVDALNCVGVDAYCELSSSPNPTPAELANAWRPYIEQLATWQALHGMPVMVIEVGYRPCEGCTAQPWSSSSGGTYCEECQATALGAAWDAFADTD